MAITQYITEIDDTDPNKVIINDRSVINTISSARKQMTLAEIDNGGTGSAGITRPYNTISLYTFSPTVEERLGIVDVIIPYDFDPTVDIDIDLIWAPSDDSAGNVVWNLWYSFLTPDGSNPLSGNQTLIEVTLPASTNGEQPDKHTFTLNTSTAFPGDELFIYLFRIGTDAADTYAQDVWVTSIKPFYTSIIV